MSEKCDDCALTDSDGKPCYMMFRKGTEIQTCSRHVGDAKKHADLVKAQKAPAASAEDGEGGKG